MTSEETLPPRLIELLASIEDHDFSQRLETIYVAAAKTIDRLGDLELLNYEAPVEDESPDLSLWEQTAPIIRDMVLDVNSLLGEIRETFAAPRAVSRTDRSEVAAQKAIDTAVNDLSQEVNRLGETMRSPSVVSDRWKLLAEVQSFRTRFRRHIGRMVKESVSAFADVSPSDIVPGLIAETHAAIQLRAAVTDLVRVIHHRIGKISKSESDDVMTNLRQLRKELDAFGRTSAYRSLRAQDKRQMIEFRSAAEKLDQVTPISKAKILVITDPFAQFVDTLGGVNEREVLIDHDRELRAALGVAIERIEQAIDGDLAQATTGFKDALTQARALYGRNTALDQFIRALRKRPNEEFEAAELRQGIEAFRELLAGLSIG